MGSSSYATPQNEIATWRSACRDAGRLPPHLTAFVQSGVSPAIGTCAGGWPVVGHGVACRIDPDGLIRVIACRGPNRALIEALTGGAAIAATFSATRDHRSIQVKAASALVGPVRPDDPCEAERQCALLADGLVELGYDRAQAAAFVQYDPRDLVSIAFRPGQVFTQTPGPGAGTELTA